MNNLSFIKPSSNSQKIFNSKENKLSSTIYIIFASLLVCTVLYFLEQNPSVNYLIKTGIKLFLFLLIPSIYFIITRDKNIYLSKPSEASKLSTLIIGLLSGIIFFAILIITYNILASLIDFNPIIEELETRLKVDAFNFLIVGVYITLGNSFIEEYFFRGFIFLKLYRTGRTRAAYIFSSLLFSLYHIMIFKNWFIPSLFFLALSGLFIVGFFFCWMDTKSKNYLNSWIAHILSDVAIILIGMKMFGIINF